MATKRTSVFSSARLRLTLWYMLISYALLAFSTIAAISAERRAFAAVEETVQSHVRGVVFNVYLQQQIDQFSQNFTNSLLLFNVVMFVAATIASYFLSGRTLRPIEKMVGEQEQFAADASHELRTPLSNIAMEIEAYRRTKPRNSLGELALLDSIQTEVERMRAMVAGLLSLVRSQVQTQLVKQTVDLSALVTQTLESMRARFEDKQLQLTTVVPPSLITEGSIDELRQILLILLDNAVKYTPKAGEVRVTVDRDDQKIMLRVQNKGVIVPRAELPHLFERFYRGSLSKESGTGLGLAIAQTLVERQGGQIAVASRADLGTIFKVTFCHSRGVKQ